MLAYFSPWLDHDRATQGEAVLSALKFVHKLDSIQEKSSMNWLTMRNESRIASSLKRSRLMFFLKNFFLLKHVLGHELLNNHSINLRAPGTVCLCVPMRWNFNRYYFLVHRNCFLFMTTLKCVME